MSSASSAERRPDRGRGICTRAQPRKPQATTREQRELARLSAGGCLRRTGRCRRRAPTANPSIRSSPSMAAGSPRPDAGGTVVPDGRSDDQPDSQPQRRPTSKRCRARARARGALRFAGFPRSPRFIVEFSRPYPGYSSARTFCVRIQRRGSPQKGSSVARSSSSRRSGRVARAALLLEGLVRWCCTPRARRHRDGQPRALPERLAHPSEDLYWILQSAFNPADLRPVPNSTRATAGSGWASRRGNSG